MARFNDGSNYLVLNTPSTPLTQLSDDITFSCWVNTSEGSGIRSIIGTDTEGLSVEISPAASDYGINGVAHNDSSDYTRSTSQFVPFDEWKNIVITYDQVNGLMIYINGSLESPSSTTGTVDTLTPIASATYLMSKDGSSQFFLGSLAEVAFWNRVLDPVEIERLSIKRYSPILIPNGIVAAWRLNGTGNTEADATGNGNTLTVVGALTDTHPPGIIGELSNILLSPHITSPSDNDMFNTGLIDITWRKNDPPSIDTSIETDNVTYEIEYTDDYKTDGTTLWRTLRRRIAWEKTSFEWVVGKMIKSKNVRIRMRAKDVSTEAESDWSISGEFSINVFDLIAPVIISPLPNRQYSDFILIVLDETPIKNTFHQKVRYTLEYSSQNLNVDWTTIVANVPVGQNVIRWDISNLSPSLDYVLRLIVRNTSTCQEATPSTPDQIDHRFVYDIIIQQSGLFIIDTMPPRASIEIEDKPRHITSRLEHVVNLFAEDDTTEVEKARLRECDASNFLPLGNIDRFTNEDNCPLTGVLDIKEVAFSPKITFKFKGAESGFRKVEALLTDSGGNISLQEARRVFLSFFNANHPITDFIVAQEPRDEVEFTTDPNGNPLVTLVPSIFEVIYVATENGELWILDPFPRLLISLSNKRIVKVLQHFGVIYIFVHSIILDTDNITMVDLGEVFSVSGNEITLISPVKSASNPTDHFQKTLSVITSVGSFKTSLMVGFSNGELWQYSGATWSQIDDYDKGINILSSDDKFLYVGFENSSDIVLYNGDTSFTLSTAI